MQRSCVRMTLRRCRMLCGPPSTTWNDGNRQDRRASASAFLPGLQRLDAAYGRLAWWSVRSYWLAGQAMGKSAAMLHFARDRGRMLGVPVCMFSLEMPGTGSWPGECLVGRFGELTPVSFRTGDVGADELAQARTSRRGSFPTLPVYLSDCANITMGTIRSQCKAMARRGRCGMVIIDYLQLLDTASRNTNSYPRAGDRRRQPFGQTAREGTRCARSSCCRSCRAK